MLYPRQQAENSIEYIEYLVEAFFETNTEREVRRLLLSILTEKELIHAATRLEIAKLLMSRIPQREITLITGVGIATVTAVSKEIQRGKYQWLSRKS